MAATEAKAEAKDAPKEVVEETLAPLRGKVKLMYIYNGFLEDALLSRQIFNSCVCLKPFFSFLRHGS